MKNIQREDIHIIAKHSSLSEQGIERALKEHVYNDKESWQKFLQLFLLTLGIGFTVSGIVFFFAYNWADLHKAAKLGLVEGMILATTCLVLIPRFNINIRNVILTGAAVLVGVLFAVFGQIYQTGANAYDFFLAWTVFVTLWVVVAHFAPLWLLYLILINTTFVLYAEQVAKDWAPINVVTSLFIFNTIIVVCGILLSRYRKDIAVPHWFLIIVALASVTYATTGIIFQLFDEHKGNFPLLVLTTALAYAAGIWHGLQSKSGFYLSIIPFSIIVIVAAFLIKISDGESMLLLVSLFIAGSITLVIKTLLDLQKKWANEK